MSDTEPDLSGAMYCAHRRTADTCEDCAALRVFGSPAAKVGGETPEGTRANAPQRARKAASKD